MLLKKAGQTLILKIFKSLANHYKKWKDLLKTKTTFQYWALRELNQYSGPLSFSEFSALKTLKERKYDAAI